MSYTYMFKVGIDTGVYSCDCCGALVPFHRQRMHSDFHAALNALMPTYA